MIFFKGYRLFKVYRIFERYFDKEKEIGFGVFDWISRFFLNFITIPSQFHSKLSSRKSVKGVIDMDNEYNYYKPESEVEPVTEEFEEVIEEAEPAMGGAQEGIKLKKQKKQKKIPKVVSVACLALIFGTISGSAMWTTNFALGKMLGTDVRKISAAGKTNTEVYSTKLNHSSSVTTSDISDVVERAMPSIVSITNLSLQEVQSFFGGSYAQEIQSSGSGSIIGQNETELLLVTNNHVIEGSNTLTVSFVDETSVKAYVKGTDSEKDLAVIAVSLEDISDDTMEEIAVATLGDSSALKVGEPAIAIGNALGYGQSVTTGIVSATQRALGGNSEENVNNSVKYVQTDAAINPGNSGGALLNINGEVIGINTVKVNADAVEGMGYAIPVSDVSDIITALMNKTTRTKVDEEERGYIGIEGLDVNSQSAQLYSMPTGVFVSKVMEGGAAEKAGITKGNIITKFDGTRVESMEALKSQLEYYKAGETVEVTIQVSGRNGEYSEEVLEMTLGEISQK